MKKLKKAYWLITLTICIFIIAVSNANSIAATVKYNLKPVEYTKEFKEYLNLSNEEKSKVIMPQMYYYNTSKTNYNYTNPLKRLSMLKASLTPSYTLESVIPNNMIIKNQQTTDLCWAFSSIVSLETNLALRNPSKVYDFSERHLDYSTTRIFANNVINPYGVSRVAASGGNWNNLESYLTNGMGAVEESQMPFENNGNLLNISAIQNKKVATRVYDTVYFPSKLPTDDLTQLKNAMKEHIKNYGSINTGMHATQTESEYFNFTTGAIYTDNEELCEQNHSVAIIGWDDNYSRENFNANHRPQNNGAWKAKNSWGTTVGKNGYVYISYEDINVYKALTGITKAEEYIDYENIYQYNYSGQSNQFGLVTNKVYIGNKFTKKTSGVEYINAVAINVPQNAVCKVYVNVNNSNLEKNSLTNVALKVGQSISLEPGYHTIEFVNPIQIIGNEFAVVVECAVTEESAKIATESKISGTMFSNVQIESEKCFVSSAEGFEENSWLDLSKLSEHVNPDGTSLNIPNGDSTLKAFTVSEVLERIAVTKQPDKKLYAQGENFNTAGMVVTAYYANGTSKVITDYTIKDGNNLQQSQKTVTISYKGKTTTQSIEVTVQIPILQIEKLEIQTPPTKVVYTEGENFNKDGMVVIATYSNGTKEQITDYTIKDGNNLNVNQNKVTIEYDGKTVTQTIKVLTEAEKNEVEKLEINVPPTKVKYEEGENFDPTGMVVVAVYKDGRKEEIAYDVVDGTNLTKDKTVVTIKYNDKTITQPIQVTESTKKITGLTITQLPYKLKYIQNVEELDLRGGMLGVTYNNTINFGIAMTNKPVKATGFSNKNLGKVTITLTYEGKQVQFDVEIVKSAEDLETRAKNSDFSKAKVTVPKAKIYAYTKAGKEDYVLFDTVVNTVNRYTDKNDSYEYYYYLSDNQGEVDIKDWVKIPEAQKNKDKLQFQIDTKDVKHYKQLTGADALYVYIKEVAIKDKDRQEFISNSMLVDVSGSKIETYINDKLQKDDDIEDGNNSAKDNTITNDVRLPQTGIHLSTIAFVIAGIAIVAIIVYFKYKRIEK